MPKTSKTARDAWTSVLIRFPNETFSALDEWRSKQDFAPNRSDVIRRAVEEFLARATPTTRETAPDDDLKGARRTIAQFCGAEARQEARKGTPKPISFDVIGDLERAWESHLADLANGQKS